MGLEVDRRQHHPPRRKGLYLFSFQSLGEVLDRLSTFVDAIVLAVDVNIRLEHMSEPQSALA